MISIEELHQLKKLGNVPFEAYVLRNTLSYYQSPEKKILKLVRDGYIILTFMLERCTPCFIVTGEPE